MKRYANHYGYSDIHPYEIIERVSDKTLVVREMKSKLHPDWKPNTVAGGFFGYTTNNNEQRWNIQSDAHGHTKRIRYSVAKNRWQDANGSRFILENMPKRKHDYNF